MSESIIYMIVLFCTVGIGYSSYKIGIKEGARRMLDYLEEHKIINIDEEGKVTPRIL
jgi:hypothetical protein|tara:strand:- start:57 stop:227 length:171 start_codon:yes stop_codon:yes gene_type:complete